MTSPCVRIQQTSIKEGFKGARKDPSVDRRERTVKKKKTNWKKGNKNPRSPDNLQQTKICFTALRLSQDRKLILDKTNLWSYSWPRIWNMLDLYVGRGRRIYEDKLPNVYLLYVLYYIALSFPFRMLKQMIFLDQGISISIYIYIYK